MFLYLRKWYFSVTVQVAGGFGWVSPEEECVGGDQLVLACRNPPFLPFFQKSPPFITAQTWDSVSFFPSPPLPQLSKEAEIRDWNKLIFFSAAELNYLPIEIKACGKGWDMQFLPIFSVILQKRAERCKPRWRCMGGGRVGWWRGEGAGKVRSHKSELMGGGNDEWRYTHVLTPLCRTGQREQGVLGLRWRNLVDKVFVCCWIWSWGI